MGVVIAAANNQIENHKMDRARSFLCQGQLASSSSTRVERKTLEKNRRNKMKGLYFMLNSLLPNQDPKDPKPLPDQIDSAVNHIKCVEASIKEAKEKKEALMSKKRLHSCCTGDCSSSSSRNTLRTFKEPKIEVRVQGSALQVTLVTAVSDQFIFTDMVRILHEENVEVVNANFSFSGSSVHHLVHAQIGEYGDGVATVIERLKKLVNGSPDDHCKVPELLQQSTTTLWNDFEISPDFWDFEIIPGFHAINSFNRSLG